MLARMLILVFLACAGHAKRIHAADKRIESPHPVQSLASFLMAFNNPGLLVRQSQRRNTDAQMMAEFSPLTARRSVVKYDIDKPVPEEVTTRALEAAILAPNHFLSEPWRFYTCGPETKEKLRGLNEDKRKMVEGVPEMLVVTVASEHDLSEKLGLEDHAAVSAAVQNFMLQLAADGLGSKWMTGALGVAPEAVLEAVGAPEGEKLMGVIWYGYPAKALEDAKAPPRKKGLEGVLTKLP